MPISVAAQSKAWVCGSSLVGIAGSNPTKGRDMSLVSIVCCQVEVPTTGSSLVRKVLPSIIVRLR